ncbi:MAG: hypothetical protein MK185_09935 [Saccharospirillaceae bacterium]|nr:hypothetical protein A3759_09055 [Thalassolituus sp. HI0120]MCH2040942.1 hypothetical protein [Saccharospirillaceae bacterium]
MRWPLQKQKIDNQRCLGIELHNGQAFAVLRDASGVIDHYLAKDDEHGLDEMTNWLRQQGYQHLPVVISVDKIDYELHLVEAPQVPDEELSDALRFRLKDLVHKPLEKIAVQAFRLPADAYRGRMDMAFAAAIEKSRIRQLVDWCEQNQLILAEITIPELSMLQLVAEMEPETSIGVLRLDSADGMLYLYHNGGLYLARPLAVGTNDLGLQDGASGDLSLETGSRMEKLALELQRSMDYFESQLGMGSVGQIWALIPDKIELDSVLPELEEVVNTPIRTLSLDSSFNRMSSGTSLTASLATALGGSLSYELAD